MLAYAGKGTVALQPVDLNRVVEDMTKLLEVTISKKALISYAFAKDLPNVMADLTQIGQVVLNLVGNAAEAIGEKSGAVTITTGLTHCDAAYLSVFTTEKLSEGLYVTLEVADTGCGMPEDVIARVCEPFFTTKFTGRGLGLAVVQGVVRKHNGAIRFYSELESGTTVKLIFPALEVTSDEVAPDDPSGWSGKGLVLLADDDEGARSVAAVMLERLGFSVIEACDGREAVSCFGERREEIALVLMDLMMPHMNGKEAYGEMRQADTEVPIVLCSGYNESELGARFAGRAVSAFLEKPYTLKILRATLSEILGDMN